MGLDMYLNKKIYVGAQWGNTKGINYLIDTRTNEEIEINVDMITSIKEQAIYWRKANMIHKWFVDNVQEGEDNCKEYYVEVNQLRELLDLCEQVSNDHSLAPQLLPVQEGFFFGSYEYDNYYFEEIEYTITELKKLLEDYDKHNETTKKRIDYSYQSSW